MSYSYPEPGPDPRSCYPGLPRGHSYDTATWARDPRAEPPPPPAPRTQAETGWASGSSGAGGRRRLPDESLVTKRRPWQGGLSLLTGWSQDDLTREKAANTHAHYGNVNGTNGYLGEIKDHHCLQLLLLCYYYYDHLVFKHDHSWNQQSNIERG